AVEVKEAPCATSQERQRRLEPLSLFASRYALRGPSGKLERRADSKTESPALRDENKLHNVRVVIVKYGTKSAMKLESVRPQPRFRPRFEQKKRLARTSRALLSSAYPRKKPCPMSVPLLPQCLQAKIFAFSASASKSKRSATKGGRYSMIHCKMPVA